MTFIAAAAIAPEIGGALAASLGSVFGGASALAGGLAEGLAGGLVGAVGDAMSQALLVGLHIDNQFSDREVLETGIQTGINAVLAPGKDASALLKIFDAGAAVASTQ